MKEIAALSSSEATIKKALFFPQPEMSKESEKLLGHEVYSRYLYDQARRNLLKKFGIRKISERKRYYGCLFFDLKVSEVSYLTTPEIHTELDGEKICLTVNNNYFGETPLYMPLEWNEIYIEAKTGNRKVNIFSLGKRETKNWLDKKASFEQIAEANMLLSGIRESLEEKAHVFELSIEKRKILRKIGLPLGNLFGKKTV
jgi:hypothetical protein